MIPAALLDALRSLTADLVQAPAVRDVLIAHWKRSHREASELPAEVLAHASTVDRALPALTRSSNGTNALTELLRTPSGQVVLAWCAAACGHREVRLAPLLTAASARPTLRDAVAEAARARVLEGPLTDALACVPLLGPGEQLYQPEFAQVRARLEILLWEAGASALQLPELGAWLWSSHGTFEAVIGQAARGTLRGRVLAARWLEVCARGLPFEAPPQLVARTMQVLQPLLLHPEPLVWVHAARALGRLTAVIDALEGTILDWTRSESALLQQRAVTAFASLPAERLKVLAGELSALIEDPEQQPSLLAAAGAATPYLYFERRDVWDKLANRVLNGDGGAVAARALARGLATLWRRGQHQTSVEGPLRQLRELARGARTDSLDEWRRWLDVLAATDPIDGAERDPLDLELGLENLARLAAQYDDEESDARAARFAEALAPTFIEARRIALAGPGPRRRAAGLHALEGIGRSLALRLWGPLLSTRPFGSDPVPEPDLTEPFNVLFAAPEALLDVVRERREAGGDEHEVDLALEVHALRLGGYALDACDEEPDLGPGRGPTAHHTCLWLRKLEGLADGSRELPSSLRGALSALFWRLVDTTRGTALGEVDDASWLGPFAAWWALVIDRPAMLKQLASALPMISSQALARCTELADALRSAVLADPATAAEGRWLAHAQRAMAELHASDTELAHALSELAHTLAHFATVSGARTELDGLCMALAGSAERLHGALADPVAGLSPIDPENPRTSENAPRFGAQLARAVRARDLGPLEVWISSLGPVTSALVDAALQGAVRRTPPPPKQKSKGVETIEGYELVKPLGEGGIGSVWLVRKPGADRLFVLKIPKADALAEATDAERDGILDSFVEEARALAGLYHPNVANIIDRGVSGGVPFLVLEYLIGADLKAYAGARLMSLFELRSVVMESCAGLHALHGAGLVHRDVKPANLWLRLPLAGGERFDPGKHRDPARTPPLATVVIDFGMVRAMKVSPEAVGRFVAGTPGYIAPEQVLDPMELDGRADVYALAGTIYNVTTGRAFFDDITSLRDRFLAHMQRPPLEDPERVRGFPAEMTRLLRAATERLPQDRPTTLEFGRAFAAAL